MKMQTTIACCLILLAGALMAGPAQAGGWAVVTLEDWPAQIGAGQPFTLRFAVRQHGQDLLGGLNLTVEMTHTAENHQVTASAIDGEKPGYYEVTLDLPAAGEWTWSVDAFGAVYPMPPLTVAPGPIQSAPAAETAAPASAPTWPLAAGIAALLLAVGLALGGRPLPRRARLAGIAITVILGLAGLGWYAGQPDSQAAQPGKPVQAAAIPVDGLKKRGNPAEMGEILFVAKGCTQCHQNRRVTLPHFHLGDVGPDLSAYSGSPEYLGAWLADPQSVKSGTIMPDLDLSESEIAALVSYLSAKGE